MFRKKAIILIIVLAVLLLVSISAAGYLFWQNQQLKSQLHPVVPSNPTTNQPPKNPVPAVPEYLVKVLAKPTVIIDIDNIDEKTRDKNVAGKISIPVEIKNISVNRSSPAFTFLIASSLISRVISIQ